MAEPTRGTAASGFRSTWTNHPCHQTPGWGDDDALDTGYGDGWGFKPKVPFKLSLGLAKLTGMPPKISGTNIRAPSAEKKGGGKSRGKPSGMLMIDGVWVRNLGNSRMAWSTDHGKTWTWSGCGRRGIHAMQCMHTTYFNNSVILYIYHVRYGFLASFTKGSGN